MFVMDKIKSITHHEENMEHNSTTKLIINNKLVTKALKFFYEREIK